MANQDTTTLDNTNDIDPTVGFNNPTIDTTSTQTQPVEVANQSVDAADLTVNPVDTTNTTATTNVNNENNVNSIPNVIDVKNSQTAADASSQGNNTYTHSSPTDPYNGLVPPEVINNLQQSANNAHAAGNQAALDEYQKLMVALSNVTHQVKHFSGEVRQRFIDLFIK